MYFTGRPHFHEQYYKGWSPWLDRWDVGSVGWTDSKGTCLYVTSKMVYSTKCMNKWRHLMPTGVTAVNNYVIKLYLDCINK